jgi:O-antigen/teichoic acid export membrane protein
MADVGVDPTDVLDTPAAGRQVVIGGAARAVGYVASTLLALLGVALLTRHLGVGAYGRYQTVISLITVLAAVTDAGMGTLGIREYAQRSGSARHALMRTLLGLRLALTTVGVGATVLVVIAAGYEPELVLGAALAGLGLLFSVLQTTLSIPLGAALRNVPLTGIDVLRQALTLVAFAVLVAAGAGVAAFLAVPIPVGLVVVVVAAMLVRGQVPLLPSIDVGAWVGLLRSSVAFALAIAVGTVYIYTAQVLCSFVASSTEAGLFAASFRVFVVATAIPGLLVTVAFPVLSRAARDDEERLAYALRKLVDTTSVLGAGIALGLVVGAPFVIDVMAGSDFAGAASVLRIQAVAMLASFVLAAWGFALLSLHLHREMLVANAVALVTSLAAVGALASTMGADGAALGTLLGEAVLAAGYLVALVRARPALRPSPRIPLQAIAVAAVAGGIAVLLPVPDALRMLVALGLYGAVVVSTHLVPDEVREAVAALRGARARR